ncbi:hypothetical protein RC083_15695 [Pseudoalteromonas haloplanktis]|uniref:Uncharacterized protein n=1 Tax=Pseudoalteromonas haloplanktis TaxID=228 RepID=A0ABU1BGH1_PSEHA|nr:hypothetical protein [Pseudoalteromonas haloplanktis]MDQ9093024.1 hypothetical protein [Pseudoalteromonas haloplanktis]
MSKFFLLKYLTFFFGCMSCFILHTQFAIPAVIASCLTGLVGSFIPFPKQYESHPCAAIYAGSFAGMCSQGLISSYWELAIISFIGATLYVLTRKMFTGFGGKLGSIAFISVALFVLAKGIVL